MTRPRSLTLDTTQSMPSRGSLRAAVALSLLFSLSGCALHSAPPRTASPVTPIRMADGGVFQSLTRGGCFGACPVYTVTIHASGIVRYEGTQHVEEPGVRRRRIPHSELHSLLRRVEELGFWELAPEYPIVGEGLTRRIIDAATVSTTVTTTAGTKTVLNRWRLEAPDALKDVEHRVNQVSGALRRVTGKPHQAEPPPREREEAQ
ncbi:MAG: DUF6438 domain-containing protein [Acidobacteriota bacterium]